MQKEMNQRNAYAISHMWQRLAFAKFVHQRILYDSLEPIKIGRTIICKKKKTSGHAPPKGVETIMPIANIQLTIRLE